MKLIIKLLFALILPLPILATDLTGVLNNPDGTGATGRLYFSLSQQGALKTGGCGGPVEIVPTNQVVVTVTAGALMGSPHVYGNDCILPENLYYLVIFKDNNGNTIFTDRWVITGASIDIGTIVSAVVSGTTTTLGSPGFVQSAPPGTQTVAQPVGTDFRVNLSRVTTKLTLPDGSFCDVSGCTGIISNAVTITGAQTISGIKTFSASPIFSGGAGIGTAAAPAATGFMNAINTKSIQIDLASGSLVSPTDSFSITNPSAGLLNIYNHVGAAVIRYDATPTIPTLSVTGALNSSQGLYMAGHSGDYNCAGAVGSIQTLRTDVAKIQVCIGSTLYSWTPGVTAGTVTNAAALTSNLPVIGQGGNAVAVGTKSGTTTEFATVLGATTASSMATWNAGGDLVDGGPPSVINPGTTGQIGYYAGAGIALTGFGPGTTTTVVHGNASGAPTYSAVVEADITLATSNTTNDVSITKHGFAPVLPNDVTKFLSGLGTYLVPPGSTASALVRTCEIVVGDPGAASTALVNDNDSPDVCTNDTGATLTITAVHCYSDAGSPTVTPIITGGSGTSILSGALTCSQTQGGAAGTLNGTPTQTNGQSIDGNITTAGGTAKYIVLRITRTL